MTSLHPEFYKLVCFWNVKSTSNYIEKLILMGIATTTLWECIEVGREGDKLSYILWNGKMVTPTNSYMDEVIIFKESIFTGTRWCDNTSNDSKIG